MALSLNGQSFSTYELQVACAVRRYMGNDDETIGFIISYVRYGFGRPPVDCRNLVSTVQQCQTGTWLAVNNNRACWEPEARRLYNNWLGACGRGLQR